MSGFEVIEGGGGLWSPPVAGSEKSPVCGGLSYSITYVFFDAKAVKV